MQKLFTILVVLSLGFATAPSYADECNGRRSGGSSGGGEIFGTLLGAALGGLVGSQIGSGTGKKVAIGAGVLAGGVAGNRIGSAMDCQDRRYHGRTAQTVLETQRSGTPGEWQNPDSGHYGTVTPTRTYQRNDGTYCREFTQSVTIDGRTEQAYGTACRQPDATWKIVSR